MTALLGRLIGGARALLRREQVDREMDDELRAYLEMEVERRMAGGMGRSQAARAAHVAMGGVEVVKDQMRDAGWDSTVDGLWQDVRYAIRGLRRSPGFTTVAIVTLALGIGANSAVFSVVNTLLLRALPVAEPQRLVRITATRGVATRLPEDIWTYGIWNAIRQRSQPFDRAFAWSAVPLNLAQGGETAVVDGLFASGDYFTALGVPALIGRTFTPEDDVRGGGPSGPVAVISYGLWQRRFGAMATIVGTPIVVEHVPFTIVGVTPPEFFGVEIGRAFDVAVPIGTEPLINGKNSILDEAGFWLTVMLRLKPGQSREVATAVLRGMQPQIREAAMPTHGPPGLERDFLTGPFVLMPAAVGTSRLREQYARPLLAILAVVAVVLLVACVNLANLLLARAAARRHEYSVRTALGAAKARLVRQSLMESMVLAGAGALMGLVIGAWGSRALVSQLSNHVDRLSLTPALDWRVLAFTMAVAAATALFFGTTAALRSARALPIEAVKTPGHGSGAAIGLPSGLVVGQVALALVLVVVGGLFVRTFERLASLPRGFSSDPVLLVRVDATRARPDPASRLRFYEQLVGAVAAVPGVASAAVSMVTPVSDGSLLEFIDLPGGTPLAESERTVLLNYITPGWFATYGTAIRAGRDINAGDAKGAPRVFVVNEAFARKFFAGRNAIGATVANPVRARGQTQVPKIVVGVVEDAVYRSLREEAPPTVYAPLAQLRTTPGTITISVRSASSPPALLSNSITAALTAVEGNLSFSFRPLEDQVKASLAQERLIAMLSGFFGALALLLASIGIYGITSYAVVRRRTEIGIRMALGARRTDVMRLVLGRTLVLTAAGIAVGLTGALAITRSLEGMLFGLTPLDPATFLAVSVLFASVAALAAFVPARRATTVDPIIALRCE